MAIRDSVGTHFVGSKMELQSWRISDWISVAARLLILATYILLQTKLSVIKICLSLLVENPVVETVLVINASMWKMIPILGKYPKQILPKTISCIKKKLIPLLEKASQLVQLSFQLHIVELTLKNKRNVQIFITAESDDLELFNKKKELKTTLLLANHRSLTDYMLINYLVQNSDKETFEYPNKKYVLKKFWNEGKWPIPKLNFVSWGKIMNFPYLSLLRSIVMEDENVFVQPRRIKDHLQKDGNQVLAIFPEVNIMTTELAIVQRKLNQDYPFVARFYNVLYPRFKNFVSIVKCFAHISKVKRRPHNAFFDHAKLFFENGMDKLIFKTTCNGRRGLEEQQAHAAMIVGLPNSPDHVEMTLSDGSPQPVEIAAANPNRVGTTVESNTLTNIETHLEINEHLYDLTIIYYRPRYTNVGHDHVNGCIKIHNGYQLEQVNPSLLEMLKPDKYHLNAELNSANSSLPPTVIMVHIKKHEVAPLLPAKVRNLEKWLETQWFEKDKLIDSIENGIKIK
ncbi:MUM3 (YOR298W) [Zygosaccharomyces parabailii]|nr:MUM3 (YOR298W) [Zygosaccharomyces parabailii]CDH12577.1 related to MUM3-Protein involved in the organization of the outer spore wall layers [Zygosaccharomyces bailii ISA1307]